MFRKSKRPFRRSFRRKGTIPARKIPPSIARVRTNWVTLYNISDSPTSGGTSCAWLHAPWSPVTLNVDGDQEEQCFSSWSFDVLDATRLTDNYGDDVKIVKMVGNFWVRPVFEAEDACAPDNLAEMQANWSDYFVRCRGGLFKTRTVSGAPDTDPVRAHPLFGRDWSDAGFLKTFERNWHSAPPQSTSTTYGQGQIMGPIGNVTRSLYNTPPTATGNQSTFNVPAIETACAECFVPGEGCHDGPSYTRYIGPQWKRIDISSRKIIRMREDDSLVWMVDWARFKPGSPLCGDTDVRAFPCAMNIIPSLKIKVQYG